MNNSTDKDAPTKKGLVAHAEFALKAVGASAALTAIMGWPAVSLHFSGFGIPADLVSTEAAIRAGIQPALTFMLLFGYIWYVRAACLNWSPAVADARFTPLFLFHVVPLAAAAMLVRIVGLCCGVFLAFWWTLSVFGVVNEPTGPLFWTLIGLSLLIGIALFIVTTFFVNKLFRSEISDVGNVKTPWALMFYLQMMDYIYFVKHFIALYLIYLALAIVAPGVASWFSVPAMLVAAAFLALAGVLVGVGIAIMKGATDLGLGNLHESTGFVVIAALLAVLLYSVDIYPVLSKSMGGGRPDIAELWVDRSAAPGLADWPGIQFDDNHYHLASAHLLHLDSDIAIIVEHISPPARWVVISRDAVVSIVGADGGT